MMGPMGEEEAEGNMTGMRGDVFNPMSGLIVNAGQSASVSVERMRRG
jgi:hypothetical protein